MAITVLELHHHGIRVGPSPDEIKKAHDFYHGVLGLDADPGRPHIPTIDGYWMDVGGNAQIHLMGVDGMSKFAKGPDQDPSRPHVALAVADIVETRKELDRLGVTYWMTEGVVGPQSQQLFMYDPFHNMIELHQIDTCRCNTGRRSAAAAPARMS
jgi:catechol 2,3-dioxygenase-like lactoylglutathione lyase family enzyme